MVATSADRLFIVQGTGSDAAIVQLGLAVAGYEVERARGGLDLVPRCASAALTIVDGSGPKGGAWFCRTLRGRGVPRPVLVLSRRPSIGEEVAVLDAGGDDYLAVPHDLATLLARVRALLRRAGPVDLVVGAIRLVEHEEVVIVDGVPRELTRRELALLRLLARRAGEVVSRQEVLASWNMSHQVVSNVIDVHVARLREKLGPAGAQLETVRGRGLRLKTS